MRAAGGLRKEAGRWVGEYSFTENDVKIIMKRNSVNMKPEIMRKMLEPMIRNI